MSTLWTPGGERPVDPAPDDGKPVVDGDGLSLDDAAGRRDEPQQGIAGNGLPAAAFAYQADGFSPGNLKGDLVDGTYDTFLGMELDAEVADVQERHEAILLPFHGFGDRSRHGGCRR